MEELSGHIERITYHNPENAFTVAKLSVAGHLKPIAIIGTLVDLQPGESITCYGSWKIDPKHGQQFIVERYTKKAPATIIGIEKYLASGLIKGIGPKYAEKIVQCFGLQTLSIIEKCPERLLEIEGLGKKKLSKIIDSAKAHQTIQEVMVFLQSHQITPAYAQKIYKRYGDQSITVVQENPYRLAQDISGIGFKMADKMAISLNIEKDSPARIAAGLEFILMQQSQNGHVCYPKPLLIDEACLLLEVDSRLIEPVVDQLITEKRLEMQPIGDTSTIWLKPLYIAEVGIVSEVDRLLKGLCTLRKVDVKAALEWISEKLKIRFASAQKEAIQKAVSEKMLIITGGPGTGKSTITKAIIQITEKLSKKVLLAAPTGKAAKRMSEITYRHASTIHSLLEYDFKLRKFKKGPDNPLVADLVIVDEASMIDTFLMHQFLRAIPSHARVIFIGDIDQLPSVGPGNVLRDLIASEAILTQTLQFIFRQQKGSKISHSAYSINQGYFPKLVSEPDDDFFFIEKQEPEAVLQAITDLCSHRIPEKYGFDPIQDIQVLAPMRKGIIGTENLNYSLQKVLNPGQAFLEWGHKRLSKGDKVMQLRNNYQKEVFNGDVGIIESIQNEERQLVVRFDHKRAEYEFSELDEINLSYAVSIHKFQGSESPCVVMPIHTHHFKLLCRNLLYTGVTRAKKLLVLVGSKKALAIAIKNDEIQKRYTSLCSLFKNAAR